MSFYLKKSISVGPFRFNFSKSGIGVSTGIPGFRIGASPRGNYIHMGRKGLYYRKTFSAGNRTNMVQKYIPESPEDQLCLGFEPLTPIESSEISKLVDSSSEELLLEMNEKRKKITIWPFVALCGYGSVIYLFLNHQSQIFPTIITVFSTLMVILAYMKDQVRKSTVLFYEMESEIESLYQQLHKSFIKISSCSAIWHVEAEGSVKDRKRNAGATKVIKRNSIYINKVNPPYIKTNISVPSIPVGKQTLYFFPDKVLVFQSDGVGAVSYENLNISVVDTQFIEDGQVPSDSKIVDRTWMYVNKRGGPDKRFKNNMELPIVLYEDIDFTSNTGLNERIEISRIGLGEDLKHSILSLTKSFGCQEKP